MSSQFKIDVIIPAGGKLPKELARQTGTADKALLRIGEETLLQRTMDALHGSERVERIVVVGDEQTREEARRCGAEGIVETGESGPANMLRGLHWLMEQPTPVSSRTLIAASDMPFLTPLSVQELLNACPPHAELMVPLIPAGSFQARFPAAPLSTVRLREGEFATGCLYLVSPQLLDRTLQRLEQVFRSRKSLLRTALLAGPEIALRFATGRLAIPHVVGRVEKILGCRAAPVFAPPETAFDIDDAEDYAWACRHAAGANEETQ